MIGNQKNYPITSQPMTQAIINYLERFKDLTPEDMALIVNSLELRKKAKGERLDDQERYDKKLLPGF